MYDLAAEVFKRNGGRLSCRRGSRQYFNVLSELLSELLSVQLRELFPVSQPLLELPKLPAVKAGVAVRATEGQTVSTAAARLIVYTFPSRQKWHERPILRDPPRDLLRSYVSGIYFVK
jgi:hypothetical protein